MALEWQTLGGAPDSSSPGGGAEIRHVVRSPLGDLTHAVCRAGEVAPTHDLPELDEAYFVLAGEGQIWRSLHGREAITRMRPGRAVWMPAGTQFQYRANQTTSLVFLVVVMPPWKSELFHTNDAGPWTVGADGPAEPTDDSWLTVDVRRGPDETAPDGSEIRLLGGVERGSLAHCLLHPGAVSSPVRHRTVQELWYVVSGHGELWRQSPDGTDQVDLLWPGAAVDIPLGVTFQFRATGLDDLELILLTMPPWPGTDEAVAAGAGRWT
ncbi:cupin domain-containing protein [Kribbella sp. NBC_00662]|uniref:cupin domain-containing protein n=1 Tax=Kribbella sp. NBC_00662 TaxID=2975969 RepID=UPI00324D1A57